MEKVQYKRSAGDEVVVFDGRNYCVKTPWQLDKEGNVFLVKAVEEGAALVGGKFPAVELEAFWLEDGSWDVISVWDLEHGGIEDVEGDADFFSCSCGLAA